MEDNDILLNVVVWADYRLPDAPEEVVLGVDHSGFSYILEPDGEFSVRSERIEITQARLAILHTHNAISISTLNKPLLSSLIHICSMLY